MKVIIDQEACIGCGMCAGNCPEVFQLNIEGKSEIKPDVDLEQFKEQIIEAISNCPMMAVRQEE